MEAESWLVIGMFASFMLLLFSGFPVAWVLAGVGVAFAGIGWLSDQYGDTATGLDYNTLGLLVPRIFAIMQNWVLVAMPLFIFMGLMLDKSGVAERMLHSMQRLFGRVHGGLAVTVMLVGVILAASTGIIGASVVLLGLIGLPVMLHQGYHKPLALGTVASAGCLGILLPPSVMLVIMGDQLRIPVGDLFLGAVFPGLVLAGLYLGYLLWQGWRRPQQAPLAAGQVTIGWADLLEVVRDVVPPGLLILAVLGSIFAGVATVTEAAGIGAFGALLLALLNRRLQWAVLHQVLVETLSTTGYIFAILIGATVFSLVLQELGGDQLIESALTGLGLEPFGLVAFVLLVIFLLGFFLDWIEISFISLPLLGPIIAGLDLGVSGYGVIDNPELVWFALLVAVVLQTSFLTPPVGFAIFYLKGVSPPDVELTDIYRGVVPFVLLQLIGLALLFWLPELAIWLPAQAYG